jgi:two-component system sensor histidine kinase KdpD
MSKAGNGEGSWSGARAQASDAASAPQDREHAGRDYRRARELLWMAAHDLSAPLAAIRMHARAKERENRRAPLSGDDWVAVLGRVERLVEGAQAMIDDVLAVERLRQRPAAPAPLAAVVDAEQVLSAVIAMQSVALKRAGCSVFVKRGDDLGRVCGRWNEVSLERLFSNLIQNVVRHAPGVPIEISFVRRDGQLQIHFADGGPGLPVDTPTAPAVAFADSGEDGHGLGLWIVYRLVAEMGGEITMQSRAGKGLAFDIRLPFAEVVAEVEPEGGEPEGGEPEGGEINASGGDQAVQGGQP